MVGSALVNSLRADGHSIARLVRSGSPSQSGPAAENIRWEPPTGSIDLAGMEGADALVHLAGASIADYGDRGDETLAESAAPGNDFLAQVCRDWEAETAQAERLGIRTAMLRLGIILAANGGALKRILVPFRLGAGGRLGNGRQWMSWITLDEVVSVIRFAIENDAIRGAVNTVAPNPVTNAEFTSVLAGVLHRPALFPAPRVAMRLAMGEMADALLFSSQRVAPQKLQSQLYAFRHPELKEALESVLR